MNESHSNHEASGVSAIILAAGQGTRMNSDLPKVAHLVAGRPMVSWIIDAVREVKASPIVLVVGYMADTVREICDGDDSDIRFAEQSEQLGTGHAVLCAKDALDGFEGDVLILAGDGVLVQAQTLHQLLAQHRSTNADATLATATIGDPTGYGRIIRNGDGRFSRIVEHRDATPDERTINEINPSYYCCRAPVIFDVLAKVTNNNAKGEYYLTDAFELLKQNGGRIELMDAVTPEEVLSINTPEQLQSVDTILKSRIELAGSKSNTRQAMT